MTKLLFVILISPFMMLSTYGTEEELRQSNSPMPFENIRIVDVDEFISMAMHWDTYVQQLAQQHIKKVPKTYLPLTSVKKATKQINTLINTFENEIRYTTRAEIWRIYAGLSGDIFERTRNPLWGVDAYNGLRNATLLDVENPNHLANLIIALKSFEKQFYSLSKWKQMGVQLAWGHDFVEENNFIIKLIGIHLNDQRISKLRNKYYSSEQVVQAPISMQGIELSDYNAYEIEEDDEDEDEDSEVNETRINK